MLNPIITRFSKNLQVNTLAPIQQWQVSEMGLTASDFDTDGNLKLFTRPPASLIPTDHTATNFPDALRLEFQGTLTKFGRKTRFVNPNKHGGGKRGKVLTFSPKSRKNMIETLNRIDWVNTRNPKFITLTYGQDYPDDETCKIHVASLIKRLERIHPETCGFWRVELQKRNAPHFHLFCFKMPFLPHRKLARMWAEIIGDKYCDTTHYTNREIKRKKIVRMPSGVSAPFVQIKKIVNHRQAMYYVSKYLAKVEPTQDVAPGTFSEDVASGGGSGSVSDPLFINVTYLTADFSVVSKVPVFSREVAGRQVSTTRPYFYENKNVSHYQPDESGSYSNQKLPPFYMDNPILSLVGLSNETLKSPDCFAPFNDAVWVGRHWGSFNKKSLPFGDKIVLEIPFSHEEVGISFASILADKIASVCSENSSFHQWKDYIVSRCMGLTYFGEVGDNKFLLDAFLRLYFEYKPFAVHLTPP